MQNELKSTITYTGEEIGFEYKDANGIFSVSGKGIKTDETVTAIRGCVIKKNGKLIGTMSIRSVKDTPKIILNVGVAELQDIQDIIADILESIK